MGNHTLAIILLLLLGSATCVAIGGFVCIAVKKSANFKNGLIVERVGRDNNVLKLMPPLVIEDENLIKGLEILKESVKAIL